jgi:hypothetical protein
MFASVSALALTGVSTAGYAATDEDMAARLAAAEARIAELEAQESGDQWLTEARADEIRSLVQDVLADADTRSSLLQSGMTAGYDNGAVLGSSDGNWTLKTNLLLQTRFVYNNQSDNAGNSADTNRWGFETTRARFIMTGNVVSPEWDYRVDVNVTGPSGRGGVGEAWIGHDCGDGHGVKFGTFKAPLLREELVEAQYQLAVERSLANYAYTSGYVDGFQYGYTADQWRVMVAVHDGPNSGTTSWAAFDTEFALGGRFEYLAMGSWDQFVDFTSPQGSDQGLLIGGAAEFSKVESGTGAAIGGDELLKLTIDASYEADGWNLYGAFIYTDVEVLGVSTNPMAFIVQGGFYVAPEWEIFARYEYSDNDGTFAPPLDDEQGIITGGVTRYFAGHNAKWTTDIGFGMDTIAPGNALTGWRSDLNDDGQFVFRTQFQILF